MKILLFGQIGSGKSFIGEYLQREFGIAYHDADRDLPESIVKAIQNHQPVSEEMRDQFTEKIADRIRALSQQHEDFCIAQALFKNRHRLQLLQEFADLRFVWVKSPLSLLNARLQDRTGNVASQYYAQMVNPQFEPPSMPHWVLENCSEPTELHERIMHLLSKLPNIHPA